MSKQQPTYSNDPEELKEYITKDEFDAFYKYGNYRFNSRRDYDGLSEAQKAHIEFFIRSPEITPSIKGYISAYIPGSDNDNNDGIGLVGYIPADIDLSGV